MPSRHSLQSEKNGNDTQCPRCGYTDVHRLAREGFIQGNVYPILGYYPWRCPMCRNHFMLRKRNGRKRAARLSEHLQE